MAISDDERPKKPAKPTPGEELSTLSLHDLQERIDVYRSEIARLEAEMEKKRTSRAAADSFFKL